MMLPNFDINELISGPSDPDPSNPAYDILNSEFDFDTDLAQDNSIGNADDIHGIDIDDIYTPPEATDVTETETVTKRDNMEWSVPTNLDDLFGSQWCLEVGIGCDP